MALKLDQYVLPLATAVGAFGGFPKPPALFSRLADNEIFQHLLLFVLIWQGGSGQNARKAAITTLMVYVGTKVLDMLEN